MQKLFPRLLLLPMMLFAMLCFAAPASAADGWLPGHFDAHQRVYVDPALSGHPQYPVNLDGVQAQLDQASRAEGFEYYLVVTQKGTGTIPSQYNGMYAPWQLDELINRWSSQSGFPASKAIVIMLVRSDKNPNAFAWAINPGTVVRESGVDRSFYSDSYLNGLRSRFLPNDIKGWAATIAQDSNGQAHSVIAHRQFMAMLPIYIGIGFVIVLLLGTFLFFFFRYRKAVAALKKELDTWAPKITSVTTLFQQLNDPQKGFLDFLSDQKGRRESFTGDTKTKYDAALADYSMFVVRRQLAADLYTAAKAAFDNRKFIVSTGALATACASLTTTKLVITGKEKKLTEITDAFGGTVETWTKNPSELLADINTLFNRVNKALGEIMEAFKGASKNKGTIEATLKAVEAMEKSVTDAGLNFEVFRTREQAIQAEATALLADISGNPIGKLADSTRINDAVADLKGDIEKCVAIKGELPTTLAGIGTVRKRVATVRGTATAIAYPLIEGEKAGTEAAPTFLLKEAGNDPDTKLTSADKHASACEAALQAGEWEQAKAAKEAAEADTTAANGLVDTALAAKKFVEGHVPSARSSKATLAGKLPAARTAATSLHDHFLAANFKGEPEKVETAQTVTNGTEGVISKVRAAYFAQDFVSARETLAALEASIASADSGLAQVHAKLAELEGLRTHARTTAADAVSKSTALKTKRQTKQFTTAAATDDAHKTAMPKVATLKANVDQDVADWPALAAEADALVAQLLNLDQQVDASERAYNTAKAKVEAVETSVETAATACANRDVLQPAKDKLATARQELTALQSTLETAKADWVALATKADSKKDVADGAKRAADQDVEDAKDARTAVRAATTLVQQNEGSTVSARKTGGYQNKSFSKSVTVNLSAAESELEAANQCLSNRQWKKAKEHADAVAGKIRRAEESAQETADQQVQQMIVIWIQQNPEPAPTPSPSSSSGNDGFSGSTGISLGGGDSNNSVGQSIGGQHNNF
jgi:hypothetical protein